MKRARNIPRRTMQPVRRIVALDETGKLTKETALPHILRIVERANPTTCAGCGEVFHWKSGASRYCSEACKKRAKRRRDDPDIGSLERRLNQRDGAEESIRRADPTDSRNYGAERLFPHIPGARRKGFFNDAGDHREDDAPSEVKARPSAYGFRSRVRCVACGDRTGTCDCRAGYWRYWIGREEVREWIDQGPTMRRLLPGWDSGMAARRVQKHTGWSVGPPRLTSDPFWPAAQFGAKLIGEKRKNERPLGEKALRRKIERHERQKQERKMVAAQAAADARLRRLEERLERIERQNNEILVWMGDEAAISREVDAFLATAAEDGCGVKAFAA